MVYMTETVSTEEAISEVRRRQWAPTPADRTEGGA